MHNPRNYWSSVGIITSDIVQNERGAFFVKDETALITPVKNQLVYPNYFWATKTVQQNHGEPDFKMVMIHESDFKIIGENRCKQYVDENLPAYAK